jgi:biopolymer transport protein ExbB/TolQ
MHILDATIVGILFAIFALFSYWYIDYIDDSQLDENGNERED